jgi:SAM-dependent methyltransferase
MAAIATIIRRILKGGSLDPHVQQTICWGTKTEAARLGRRGADTRWWAHAWIRCHMEALRLAELRVLDAGSGLSNRLLDWYRPRVGHAYLLDFLAPPGQDGNTTIIQADLEKDIPLADASVDLVTSASSIEHLSANGQSRFMFEAQRLLRPGGILVMTVSYVLGINDRALEIFSRDPALAGSGCNISTRLDIRRLLEAAPKLRCPVEPEWSRFPGFEGFSEDIVVSNPDILFDRIGSYGDVRCLAETDALGLRWAGIGMYLVKQ